MHSTLIFTVIWFSVKNVSLESLRHHAFSHSVCILGGLVDEEVADGCGRWVGVCGAAEANTRRQMMWARRRARVH